MILQIPGMIAWSIGSIIISIAWFIYIEGIVRVEEKKLDHKHDVQKQLKKEFDIIRESISSYPKKSIEKYKADERYRKWYYPTRVVFTFDNVSLLKLINDGGKEILSDNAIKKFTDFMVAVANFQQLHEEMQQYAFNDHHLFTALFNKLEDEHKGKVVHFTAKEKELKDKTFEYNYKLHIDLIGDNSNKRGLYYTFQQVKKALIKELNKPRVYQIPKHYIPVNIIAWMFLLLALVLIMSYFSW